MTPLHKEPNSALEQAAAVIRHLRNKVEAMESEPIAILGMSCRFPGSATDLSGFWDLLVQGKNAVTKIPADRWALEDYFDASPGKPGKSISPYGGFLREPDHFDASFFGIAPKEVKSMDPQHRFLLEVSWEAIEHAGINPLQWRGTETGVFVGITANDYAQQLIKAGPKEWNAHFTTGNCLNAAAGRIAYNFGFQGPCMAIDTACSSSLVAVHQACQSLRLRECQQALAGGVNLLLSPEVMVALSQAGMLAADGKCKTFDDKADGYVRGEGCGVIVLKRLSDALREGFRPLAVIRSSVINQDGTGSGLTVPNGRAQQNLIKKALHQAKIKASQIQYVEAHGTGTPLGDPIELQALHQVLGQNRSSNPLWVGSVKTNIGHLESAAGMAGIIKLVLALKNEKIPRQLHLHQATSRFDWENSSLCVARQDIPWEAGTTPRLASVSAFGASGTNAHLILEEAPSDKKQTQKQEQAESLPLLCLSARSQRALRASADNLSTWIEKSPKVDLGSLCRASTRSKSHWEHRLCLFPDSLTKAKTQLEEFAREGNSEHCLWGHNPVKSNKKLLFLFPGQGAQYPGMGQQLYHRFPIFRETLEQCQSILRPLLPLPLVEVLFDKTSLLDQTQYTQPALFSLGVALAALWKSWGITPSAFLGHSVGEYVGAYLAGIFSLEEGLNLIAHRARLMQSVRSPGAMLAINASEQVVNTAIAPFLQEVSIAAYNGKQQLVISGAETRIKSLQAQLKSQGIRCALLNVSHAFHSPLMDVILDDFRKVAQSTQYHPPSLPLISNLSGTWGGAEMATADYWVRQLRNPVRFSQGISLLFAEGRQNFLELGPNPLLSTLVENQFAQESATEKKELLCLSSLRSGKNEVRHITQSLAKLYVEGSKINWEGVHPGTQVSALNLPTYPFQREYFSRKAATDSSLPQDWLYQLQWITEPRQASPTIEESRKWLILTDQQGIGEQVATGLRAAGHRCQVKRFKLSADQASLFTTHYTDILHCQSLDEKFSLNPSLENLEKAQELGCHATLQSFQAQSKIKGNIPPRNWFITQQAIAVKEGDSSNPMQAPLWGFLQVLALEQPKSIGGIFDLQTAEQTEIDQLIRRLLNTSGPLQVALRGDQSFIPRLRPLAAPAGMRPSFSPHQSFLITGGLGSLGLHLAQWLIERGAQSLVLLSRNSPSVEVEEKLKELRQDGVEIHIYQADVTSYPQMEAIIRRIQKELPPLGGVIHAAGLPGYQTVLNLDRKELEQVLAPKIKGSWILHQVTKDLQLDFFLLFSSIASVWGSKGQAHYAAANRFLDQFAQWRRSQKFPALVINWGAWAEGGMAVPEFQQQLKQMGLQALQPELALQMLDTLWNQKITQAIVADVDWNRFKPLYEYTGRNTLLAEIDTGVQEESHSATSPLLSELSDKPDSEAISTITSYLRREVAKVLGLQDPTEIHPHQGFAEMGMDSMLALNLRRNLEGLCGMNISPTLIFDFPNVTKLSKIIRQRIMQQHPPADSAPPNSSGDGIAALIEKKVSKLESLLNMEAF